LGKISEKVRIESEERGNNEPDDEPDDKLYNGPGKKSKKALGKMRADNLERDNNVERDDNSGRNDNSEKPNENELGIID